MAPEPAKSGAERSRRVRQRLLLWLPLLVALLSFGKAGYLYWLHVQAAKQSLPGATVRFAQIYAYALFGLVWAGFAFGRWALRRLAVRWLARKYGRQI